VDYPGGRGTNAKIGRKEGLKLKSDRHKKSREGFSYKLNIKKKEITS